MRPVLVCAAVFFACALGSALGPVAPRDSVARDAAPARATPYGVTGTPAFKNLPATSCSASSCHGGGAVGRVGSEHSTWAPEAQDKPDSDPHNRAYRVLFNSVSVEMAKKLNLGPAHKAELCLKCHAVPAATGDADTDAQILTEGVGCSGCHGPAEKWNAVHYLPEWKALSNREKWEKYGFVPTGNLVARLLNCAQCHMGDADRDVNHALYAAGHPRITFEAAKMHNTKGYRKHWEEKIKLPDFEVRVWVVGQATQLRAAADLLRVRAERAEAGIKADARFPDRGAWPEFAGYSCYACHQSLPDADARKALSVTPRPPGTPGWEVWSNAAVKVAHQHCADAFPGLAAPSLGEVERLQELMRSRKGYSATNVAAQAAKAVRELDAWLVALQDAEDRGPKSVAPGAAYKLAGALAKNVFGTEKDKDLFADHDWDALAANYLGVAAMAHASGGANKVTWGRQLEALRDGLRFDADPNKRVRFDSPWMFDLAPAEPTKGEKLEPKRIEQLRQRFMDLRAATALTGGN